MVQHYLPSLNGQTMFHSHQSGAQSPVSLLMESPPNGTLGSILMGRTGTEGSRNPGLFQNMESWLKNGK